MNRDSEKLLAQLMTTPVGRRWILKAGLGSAAALAAATLSRSPAVTVWASDMHQAGVTPTANRTLHFALTPAVSGGIANLELVANGARTPLVAHTADSRAALQKQGGIFAAADLNALSHYVHDVPLPTDRAMLVSVHGRRGAKQVVVGQMFHTPEATTLAVARVAASSGTGVGSMIGSDERLAGLGLSATQVTTPQDIGQLDSILDIHQTAYAIAMCHPNVATIEDPSVAVTKSVLGQVPEVGDLGSYIGQMQRQGQDWATLVPATNRDGSPTNVAFKDPNNPGTVTTKPLSTIQLSPDASFRAATSQAVGAAIAAVRDTSSLGQVIDKPLGQYPTGTAMQTWVQPQGVRPQPAPYSPPAPSALAVGDGIDINIKNTGMLSGTTTVANGSFINGQVPITIYNNYVRCMWAYVQYLGKDGTNLSANSNAKWPDTSYAQSLAIVSPVSTILGVPLWGTNSVNATLTFPPDALTARLLYCGLGSDISGGGWRQYFPQDAYPDRIAPTDEVLFAALWTGIVVIGLNVFSLVTDFPVGAAWANLRKFLEVPEDVAFSAMQSVTQNPSLTADEATAASVASGGATYTDLGGDDPPNLWSILVRLGPVIPKVLFSPVTDPYWAEVALVILAEQAADKLVEAIPFIGQVVSVVEVLADVASLAEVCAETIVSPWVIENEVSLTYQATITVGHDSVASGWPATAGTWELSALLDGAVMPHTTTGPMNVGGRVQSEPLELTVTAPYGSNTIQWSIVIKDPDGHQVGTGVSSRYTNDDPNSPPADVSFAITEIPAPIDANTVFERTDTVIYSDSAGGFTWSNDASVTGVTNAATTASSSAVQKVTGVTVATSLGVVGVVWQDNDRYYLQGVPVDESGTTITLNPASREGYARIPFLLFDSFVHRDNPTESNHVLLEPDDTTDAYFVRKVSLDPATGAITWDSGTALGTFTLPVSAAALHSSGVIVTVDTGSARVGVLKPAATPRPGVATYSGGSGTQPGLMVSPTAVAVTNSGVILILDAGAGQLAALDLNGNPVQYFGSDATNLQYTQPLATPADYLDMALDGADHLYLLYVTGDASQPGDYNVDVYNSNGSLLVTSPSTNVSRLAVDYWRSIYGVNFTSMSAPGSTVSMPSISRLDPT